MPWAPTSSPRRSRPAWRPRMAEGKRKDPLAMAGSQVLGGRGGSELPPDGSGSESTTSALPAILVVADDERLLEALADDLGRRFGGGYRILAEPSSAAAVSAMDRLAASPDPVAL